MTKTNVTLADFFVEKLSHLFAKFKQVPNLGSASIAFVCIPKEEDLFNNLKRTLMALGYKDNVNILYSNGEAYAVNLPGGDGKIIINYTDESNFDWRYDYCSYGASVILGKIFKKAGCRYRGDGLMFVQKDLRENHRSEVGTIVMPHDFKRALEVLELDYNEFKLGFKTSQELFTFLIKTPYLDVKKFTDLEKESRLYILQTFQEYLIVNDVQKTYKQLTLDRIKEVFNEIDFDGESKKLLEKAQKKLDIVNKFNGQVILEFMPEFDKKLIGINMSKFKFSFGSKEGFNEYMANHSKEQVMEKFKEFVNS